MLSLTISPKKPPRTEITFYLSDPSISSEEAKVMKQAFEEACRSLESSGRKFSAPVVATLIDNYAYDGVRSTRKLVDAVLSDLSYKKC